MSQDAANLEAEILELPGRQSLDIGLLRSLSRRANLPAGVRFALHVAAMTCTGALVWLARENWLTFIPAMALHGATIVTMFAPMHECVHKTAFRTPWLNN